MTLRLRLFSLLAVIGTVFAGSLNAQQTPLPSNVQVASRPFYVEGAVVVLLMAGAIYAVCRSSRR